jgi:ATP-binding cassette subfamily C protein CydD/ATP-binding cassette subfamily C protein CydCD
MVVRPGEVVALTGPSGCAKSTALRVLLGFVTPVEGTVTVGGRTVPGMDPVAWRRQTAWVPQRAQLFADTVRANVTLGAPASDTDVRRALEQAGAAAFVAELPRGLETRLGDDGAGLSAGQRQRLALARAFLRDAPVVLLDEPTANLDENTAAEVMAAIRRLAHGRTVLMAAHRPELIAFADRAVSLAPAGVGAR